MFNVSIDGEIIAVRDMIDGKLTGGNCVFDEIEATELCGRVARLGFTPKAHPVSATLDLVGT